MSSSNLLKGGYGYNFKQDSTRIIDSNSLVADKLEHLSELMQEAMVTDDSFEEGFTEGLDALQVEQLLTDSDTESENGEEGNIIKAQPERIQEDISEMLEQARMQADQIIQDAMAEAEQQKNAVLEQARKQGYDDGFAEGMSSIRDQEKQLEEKARALDLQYDKEIDEIEPLMVDTLTDIYEHIFHVSFAENKEVIFYLIQDAVRKIEGNRNFIIHVSKEDYGFVSMQKKELLSGVAGAETAEIIEDMTLKQNECFIETGNGIFDCSLETQLSGLKRELRLLSYVRDKE